MSSFTRRTASDSLRMSGLRIPAIDERLASRRIPGTMSVDRASDRGTTYRQDFSDRHCGNTEAELLGLADCDRNAVRIIMAAQMRLRLLRMKRQTPEVRDHVRRIARARDVLLQTAVELHPLPNSAR